MGSPLFEVNGFHEHPTMAQPADTQVGCCYSLESRPFPAPEGTKRAHRRRGHTSAARRIALRSVGAVPPHNPLSTGVGHSDLRGSPDAPGSFLAHAPLQTVA